MVWGCRVAGLTLQWFNGCMVFYFLLVYSFIGWLFFRDFAFLLWGFFWILWNFLFFLLVWCFLAIWFFWFFDVFWWFFGFFYDFFSGGLNLFYSPKRVHSFTILLQFYFFCIYWSAWWGDTVECHRVKFTALRLVFNRICKSIKKYKRGGLQLQAIHVYRLHDL